MVWQPGKKLKDGQYTIEKVLEQGGFGITYLARDLSSRQVAIKTLNDLKQNDPDFPKLQDDFQKEAQKLHQCTHPYIVEVHDFFLEENLFLGLFSNSKPLLCMVMEYICGDNLWKIVNMHGTLPEVKAIKYTKQVCEALKFIHTKNILHRDVKPNNIMMKSNETIVLIDFGIARDFVQDKTQTHTIAGTYDFSPPEQFIQQARRGVSTDIYALAATLYFLLTGSSPQRVGSKLKPPNELNSSISDMVNRAIMQGMEWRPEDRPQSVDKWLQMLTPRKELGQKQKLKPVVESLYIELTTDKKNLKWVVISLMFWILACWIFLSLRISESAKSSGLSAQQVAVYRSFILAFITFPIVFFAPSSDVQFKAFEQRPIYCGVLGMVIGVIISAYNNFNNFFGLTLIGIFGGLLVGFVLGIPFVILGIAKRDLQMHFNRVVTFIILVGVSLLGVGIGWLIFAHLLL